MSENSIYGEFSLLSGLVQWKTLNLSSNYIHWSVPFHFGLENLVASNNLFDGEIPNSFFQLGNLTVLDLSQNKLVGSIPREIGELPKLEMLSLWMNSFTGEIPTGITRCVKVLYLSSSKLRGIEVVDLTLNFLEGSIPRNFSQRLYWLGLAAICSAGAFNSVAQKLGVS